MEPENKMLPKTNVAAGRYNIIYEAVGVQKV
jgi:hypothetical protein